MRYTLLEATQLILSSMDSDEINSINDTVESYQVALLLKSVFYDMATELNVAAHESLFELNASGDPDKPTLMTMPTNVTRTDWIEYNNQTATETFSNYVRVEFMPLDDFLTMQNANRTATSGANEMSFTSNGETFEVMYRDDKQPQWYTTFDDYTLLFDSYDSTLDTTLQKSKTRCSGAVYPVFTLDDSFIPDLEPAQFSYYINRAKVRAFAELKQAANQEAAKETRNQKIIMQRHRRLVPREPEIMRVPRYGRKGSFSTLIPQSLKNGD